jgi:predicted ATP-dependent protease
MSDAVERLALSPDALRWRLDTSTLAFETTGELDPTEEIIGQSTAVDAIRLGLELQSFGYNIFITGLVGTGRTTVVKRLLGELSADTDESRRPLRDLCYVHNFRDADMPVLLRLSAGEGSAFASAMERLVHTLTQQLPKVFESEAYGKQRGAIVDVFRSRQSALIEEFQKHVESEGFAVIQVQMGPVSRPDVLPAIDGEPVTFEALSKLEEEKKVEKEEVERLRKTHGELVKRLGQVVKEARSVEKALEERIVELDRTIVRDTLAEILHEIRGEFEQPDVHTFLDSVEADIHEHAASFKQEDDDDGEGGEDRTRFYRVNVIVDNSRRDGPPIIDEPHPTYRGLFGTIEGPGRTDHESTVVRADFSHLRAGSLLRADGGFLVLNARDVFSDPTVWPALKRTLRSGQVQIQNTDVALAFTPWGAAIKPEPIKVSTKVVMIGDAQLYTLLYALDDDFRKIFKVKAEFDAVMPRDPGAVEQYGRFIATMCRSEELPEFDRSAVGRVVEYGVRRAGHRDKLSTHFTYVKDVVVESAYWMRKAGGEVVRAEHVQRAIDEQEKRVGLVERKTHEAIERGQIMIDTEGAVIAQVNGLAVYSLGDHAFGAPSRITASVGVGRAGIVNIERESDLSGSTHDKGVLILAGFFRNRFARTVPIALSASLAFEQNYGGVDGDSASSTEIYALLSALSGLPIRQDFAVTGSVNQHGEIQPIGGVNEKIEGFFDVCRATGLTGSQGVLIPARNVPNLMLRADVVDAVRDGTFRIVAMETIDQGIEVLTGVAAGAPDASGAYPEGTVYHAVAGRLAELADRVRAFGTWGEGGTV